MFFDNVDGRPVPKPDTLLDGTPVVADGVNTFTLAQAVEFFKIDEATLQRMYHAMWHNLLSDNPTPPPPQETSSAALPLKTRLQLLHDHVYSNLNREQFQLFLAACAERNLSPWFRHLHPEVKHDEKSGRPVVQMITTIDGFRLIAKRTGEWIWTSSPSFCGEDGIFKDVWLKPEYPAAAVIGVQRKGATELFRATAYWELYAQYTMGPRGEKILTDPWQKWKHHQLAKCAEALAMRQAFPEEFSGLYTKEEMGQASNPRPRQGPAVFRGSALGTDQQFDTDFDVPTEMSRQELELKLYDMGLTRPHARQDVIDRVKRELPLVYQRNAEVFFAEVLRRVYRTPAAYGAKLPDPATV